MSQLKSRLPLFATLLMLTLAFAPTLPASSDNAPTQARPTIADGPLAPEAHYTDVTALVRDVIGRLHYAPPAFDSELSARAFDRYLSLLDPNRSYFLASDVAEFSRFRDNLLQSRRGSDLQPAYDIYNRFHQRILERVEFLTAQLDAEPDFTVNEDYQYDRREAAWAADLDELNEITRKRFKNDVLTLQLAGQDWGSITDTLSRRYRGLARRSSQSVAADVFQVYMNAFTTSIDPHTAYMTPVNQDNFRMEMSLSLEGIGAVLTAEDDYTRVVSIVPAGPADQTKELFPNDRLLAIAQGADGEFVDVVGWRVDDVVQLVRGPRDTTVRLMVLPADAPPDSAPRIVSIQRKKIRLEEQAAKSSITEVERDAVMSRGCSASSRNRVWTR
ncbi:MAG: PDZ domain-containing protein [Xanthomonadaceae bacterium]|nr:PDZ domain-containing protein [Xanthomonadaceae bacterium]